MPSRSNIACHVFEGLIHHTLATWVSNKTRIDASGCIRQDVFPKGIDVVPGAGFPSWTKPLTTRLYDAERTPRTLGIRVLGGLVELTDGSQEMSANMPQESLDLVSDYAEKA